MNITQDTYNKLDGKVDLTSQGTMSVLNGGGATGTVNVGAGVVFPLGVNSTNYFGNAKTWNGVSLMSDTPLVPTPYVKFIPTLPFPSNGCMIAVYAEWEGAVPNVYDGKGEIALYARFSDNGVTPEDCRLLRCMGKPVGDVNGCNLSSGWMTPKDPTSKAFIDHTAFAFSSVALAGKTWAEVKELRLVFKNSSLTKKCRLRNFYIYEAITTAPGGSVTSYTSTSNSISVSLNAHGAMGTKAGTTAKLIGAETLVENPETSAPISFSWLPAVSPVTSLTYAGLPSGARSKFLQIWDAYGNSAYVANSWGMLTKFVRLSSDPLLVTPTGDGTNGTFEAEIGNTGMSLTSYTLYVWAPNPDTGVPAYLPVAASSDNQALPLTLSLPIAIIGTDWKLDYYACWQNTETLPDGSVQNIAYYFNSVESLTVPDVKSPTIIGFTANSYQSKVRLVVRTADISGVSKIEYIRVNGDATLTVVGTKIVTPAAVATEDKYELDATPGDTLHFKVRVTDAVGNEALSDAQEVLVTVGGDFNVSTSKIKPKLSAEVLSDGNVLLSWTPWDYFMGPTAGNYTKPVTMDIHRSTVGSSAYQAVASGVSPDALEYLDTTVPEPAGYNYILVGTDAFGVKKSVSLTIGASVFGATTQYSFIEGLLQELPKWTAATGKKD